MEASLSFSSLLSLSPLFFMQSVANFSSRFFHFMVDRSQYLINQIQTLHPLFLGH